MGTMAEIIQTAGAIAALIALAWRVYDDSRRPAKRRKNDRKPSDLVEALRPAMRRWWGPANE